MNGTSYSYRVSAVNANGEGPLSSAASATPLALVPPVQPLPTIDNFDRGFENPLSDAGRWSNGVNGSAETGLYVPSIWLACSKSTTCTSCETAPSTVRTRRCGDVSGASRRLEPASTVRPARSLERRATTDTCCAPTSLPEQTRSSSNVSTTTRSSLLKTINQELAAGDVLLLRVQGQILEAWRHDGSAWARLGFASDSTYAAGGYVGVGLRGTTGRLDDFGARTMGGGTSLPSAPASLAALSGDASVSLSWQAPSFDGGSPVTSYNVYRGTSAGSETFLANAGTATNYLDSGLVNGTSYSYRVSAVNANGEGPLSSAASATPLALVPPVQPLPTIDNFDRGFENPLSDAGRWSNGVNGSAETGLYVPSIWLACSKSTTCTSWRNSAQYGPDTEVWGRLSVLPGDSNQLRLYARLSQPGTTGYDGYMLRTNQLAGTDQVLIERVDDDTFVPLKTINQELAAGDVLLLRVQGQILEAWRHDGSAWARLGFASDSTYAAGGYVGVGLRGTTGRLDDFGARTMGAPPPDTEPPSAPGTLSATAVSPSQIDLSWGAATDNVAVTLYRIERCQGAGCSNFSQIATTASTSYPNSGLSPSTAYSYRVRAQDAVPNVGDYTNTASATTLAPPDTEPPSAPGTLNASAFSATQIELTWQAATDNVAVVLYRIERCEGAGCSNFAEIGLATSTSHMDTGLPPSTSYSYRVRAQDAVPNVGDFSNTASATTPAPPDTEPPSAPGTLSATAVSPSQIDLSWGAATDNVAVTLYRIERCQGAGCSNFSQIATTASTSYPNSGLSPSTAYSYRVRAQDAVPNVGDYTNTASATTQSVVVTPSEPLPILDSFNRRNENPLSDAGRWSNGVIGSSEAGLRVVSNTLACTKSTTCTAWRNNVTYGPDTEVWARVATLPGTGNQFRLYAALQQAGLSNHSGYMLRTNQLAGTDQLSLERIDGGAIVTRLTVAHELAVGDTVLLRVKAATLEAWVKRGATWSLLGSVVDTTYSAAGRVAVGIRGKNGRLDDFGAR